MTRTAKLLRAQASGARSLAWNTLSVADARPKPCPADLFSSAEPPEPKGQDRDFIEWNRRIKVYAGASRGNRERAWKSLHGFTNALLARE